VKKLILVAYCLVFTISELYAQHLPYYFSANNIKVYNENGKNLRFPFTGGLKNPLFGMVDLNNDGLKDLVVLDRMDDRILTYRNIGIKDSFGFIYRSQFEIFLPDSLSKTITFKDYNNDGKPDLFAFASSSGAGIVVYKNVSNSFEIKFEVAANPIKSSWWGQAATAMYVSSSDIPAIVDLDGDGDLDIITFTIEQPYIEYHKNLSQELYKNSDSFVFKMVDDCWGKFREGYKNNEIILNIPTKDCTVIDNFKNSISENSDDKHLQTPSRHSGSTIVANDMDNDGDIDILLGDSGYPGMILLSNGKKETSHIRDSIIRYDTNYPTGTKPVRIRQMPGAFYLDLDNDSIKDLVVSPMDVDVKETIDGSHQVWLYKNLGSNTKPKFSFIKNDFLQDEMIDLGGPTQPVFFDYDNDGDQDLFVVTKGNYSETFYNHDRIVLFENTGSASKPEFRVKNNDFSGLSSRFYTSLTLAFGDINGDQKPDMVLGKMDGTISYFRNIATGNDTARFQWVTDYLDNIDIGNFSCPFVFDINADNFGDLFIGQAYGEISYYLNKKNTGNPEFKLITPTFGGIYFRSQQHYTSPIICDLNNNGKPELIFAHNFVDTIYHKLIGDIGFVEDIDDDTSRKYQIQYNRIKDAYSQQIIFRNPGLLLRPAFTDLDGDGLPDMMLGSSRGGLMLLTTKRDTINVGIEEQIKLLNYDIPVYPNPAHDVLKINLNGLNGNFELEIIDLAGKIILIKKINSGNEQHLNITSIPPGFYLIKLQDQRSGKKFYKKVIIQ
jgi:hypothetical protein